MPIYEFRCRACGKRFSVLTLRVSARVRPRCEHCSSRAATRLLSRFAMPKSEEARLDALADPDNLGGVDENDPKSVARWMRNMGQEMGEDADDDFGAMVDDLESGDDTDSDES